MWYVYRVIITTYGFGLTRVYSSPHDDDDKFTPT